MVIQLAWIEWLEARQWFVKPTHGSMYQSGFPDLYCTHEQYGKRWVEVKLLEMKGSKFTKAQIIEFPKFIAHGTPIWILTKVCEQEYRKLFDQKEANFNEYLLMKNW